MMLSDNSLRNRMRGLGPDGVTAVEPLVVSPLFDRFGKDDGAIQGCSVDLRLGTWFSTPRLHARVAHDLDEPKPDQEEIGKSVFIPFGKDFYLHPGSFVLAVSLEWIRMPADLSGVVTGKSKWGRRGLNVATATVVHPHFVGCITLELANIGEYPLTLKPGVPIFQMQINELNEPADLPLKRSLLVGHRKPQTAPILLEGRGLALSRSN